MCRAAPAWSCSSRNSRSGTEFLLGPRSQCRGSPQVTPSRCGAVWRRVLKAGSSPEAPPSARLLRSSHSPAQKRLLLGAPACLAADPQRHHRQQTPSHWKAPPRRSPLRPETIEPGPAGEAEDGCVDSPARGPAVAAENAIGR